MDSTNSPSPLGHDHSRTSPGLSHPRRFEESWVEVASQPSSSSLSSVTDEIVTTGLRVRGPLNRRRRRLPPPARSVPHQHSTFHPASTSSQEEYDESESESESEDGKLLTSSAEHSRPASADMDDGADDDDDDDATALGRVSDRHVFRPQPNAFSHPPPSRPQTSHSATSTMPRHPHSGLTRPAFTQRSQTTRVQRGGPPFMAPSAREDNDAALRASLTTLLSCAAAARGLPKSKEEAETWRASRNGVGPSNQPMNVRFVSEDDLMREDDSQAQQTSPSPGPLKQDSQGPSTTTTELRTDKPKRPVSAGLRSPSANKKKKVVATSADALISPTLLTWVVSAGVVVLVSVVGFGAGYVIGREVGRQEARDVLSASVSAANDTSHTGQEVIRSSGGLRRLRWGAGAVSRSIVAQA